MHSIKVESLRSQKRSRNEPTKQKAANRRAGVAQLVKKLESDVGLLEVLKTSPEVSIKLLLGGGYCPESFEARRLVAPAWKIRDGQSAIKSAKSMAGEQLIVESIRARKEALKVRKANSDQLDTMVDLVEEHLAKHYTDNRVFNWRVISRAESIADWVFDTLDDDWGTSEVLHLLKFDRVIGMAKESIRLFWDIVLYLNKKKCIVSKPAPTVIRGIKRRDQPTPPPIEVIQKNLELKKEPLADLYEEFQEKFGERIEKVLREEIYYSLILICGMKPIFDGEADLKGDFIKEFESYCFAVVMHKKSMTDEIVRSNRVKKWVREKGGNFMVKILRLWETLGRDTIIERIEGWGSQVEFPEVKDIRVPDEEASEEDSDEAPATRVKGKGSKPAPRRDELDSDGDENPPDMDDGNSSGEDASGKGKEKESPIIQPFPGIVLSDSQLGTVNSLPFKSGAWITPSASINTKEFVDSLVSINSIASKLNDAPVLDINFGSVHDAKAIQEIGTFAVPGKGGRLSSLEIKDFKKAPKDGLICLNLSGSKKWYRLWDFFPKKA